MNAELEFRRMTASDVDAVFDVRTSTVENAVTRGELLERYGVTPERVAVALRGSAAGWVCADRGRIVGFSMGSRANGEVTVLAVHPEHERRGIGRTLLGLVRDWLFGAGHEEIWLCANADPAIRAYGFYRSLGWEAVERLDGDEEKMILRRP